MLVLSQLTTNWIDAVIVAHHFSMYVYTYARQSCSTLYLLNIIRPCQINLLLIRTFYGARVGLIGTIHCTCWCHYVSALK